MIHPGSKGSARNLPIDKIMEIPEYIVQNLKEYKIVLSGFTQEKPITGEDMSTIDNTLINSVIIELINHSNI